MTSIILAGGKSSRFGQNKAIQTIGDRSLVQWIVDRLSNLSTEIIIVTAQGGEGIYQREPFGSFHSAQSQEPIAAKTRPHKAMPEIKIIADIYPDKGPLCGIYSGLIASSSSRAVVVGCDMPFPSIPLLDYMIQISSNFDVVIPRIGERVHPLCAVYSQRCVASIQSLLERNELRTSELLNMVKARYVEENEIDRFDPEHLSLFNINTQADLDEAKRLAVEKGWLL